MLPEDKQSLQLCIRLAPKAVEFSASGIPAVASACEDSVQTGREQEAIPSRKWRSCMLGMSTCCHWNGVAKDAPGQCVKPAEAAGRAEGEGLGGAGPVQAPSFLQCDLGILSLSEPQEELEIPFRVLATSQNGGAEMRCAPRCKHHLLDTCWRETLPSPF